MPNNILVIDDEMVICELLDTLLKDQGFKVTTALSAEEGIQKFKEGAFDLVMTDLKLPDFDGIKVLEAIKSHDPDTVVIVMTGYPSFETVHSALRQGAFDYVPKPFTIDEISFAVKRALAFRNLKQTNNRLLRELEEQNSKLEERVRERTQELRLLYKIGSDISSTLNLNEVLSIILDRISEILNVEICSILLLDETNKDYTMKCAKGLDNAVVCKTRVQAGESISGWVIEHKEGLLVEDIETDPRFQHRNDEKYYTRSFISVPLLSKDKVIGVININNKKSREIFTKDDYRFLEGVAAEATIGIENAQLYQSLEDSYMRTVLVLTSAIDAKDHYTNRHSQHVCEYATAVAKDLNLCEEEIKNLERACKLHDIGKIGIEDNILTKPDKLTPEEWDIMKTHPSKSAEILRPLAFLNEVIKLVEQHHERYDGTGYPSSKKAEEISLGARIITVVDSFDAMFTDRPYRKALTKEAAILELKKGSGTQFDPKVVEIFLRVLEQRAGNNTQI